MRLWAMLFAGLLCACVNGAKGDEPAYAPGVTLAQHTEHLRRMNAAEEARLDMVFGLEAQDQAAMSNSAMALRPILEAEHAFWVAGGVVEGARLAQANLDALVTLEAALASADIDRLSQAAQAVSAACSACHDSQVGARLIVRTAP